MVKWIATPLVEINGVKFGMPRSEVRTVLGGKYKEFKKSKFSKNTTDDFGICHVLYNKDDKCEAVEVFRECEVSVNGKLVFPLRLECFSGKPLMGVFLRVTKFVNVMAWARSIVFFVVPWRTQTIFFFHCVLAKLVWIELF